MIGMVLVAVIVVLHLWIMVVEMLLWQAPRVRAIFGITITVEFATVSRVLAANQGLYGGFPAAGLIWAPWPARRCSL